MTAVSYVIWKMSDNEVCDELRELEAEHQEDTPTAFELRRLRGVLEGDLVEALATSDQELP